jgi:7,8-dihydropterin-6-yl-methyl-4-(beta-D-ribofuranosyl)aminobenzene 5'-phosphate synthase
MKLHILVDNQAMPGFSSEHGLSIYVEDSRYRVLFDTGRSGTVLKENASRLGVSMLGLDGVILSHGHYDHTGGLNALARHLRGVQIFCHPELFYRKLYQDGADIGTEITAGEMEYCGMRLRLQREPQKITPYCMATGEIERSCPHEPEPKGFLVEKNGERINDIMADEQALVISGSGGLVVLLGCGHAGLINTLHAASNAADGPVSVVIGGFHLRDADDQRIARTIEALKEMRVNRIYPAHCTGEKAIAALRDAFKNRCIPTSAGMSIEI